MTALRLELAKNVAARGQVLVLPQALAVARNSKETSVDVRGKTDAKTPPPEKPRVISDVERQIHARLLQYQRWTRLGKKADLIAGLNLPPEKLAKFKELLVERDYAESDAKDAATNAGIVPDSSEATEAASNVMEQVDERIKALLGDTDFQKYGELTGIDLFRGNLSGGPIVGCFVDAGVPLTAEQTSALARALLHETSVRARDGSGQIGEPDPVTGFTPSQKMILEEVTPALSSAQMETLRSFFLNDNQLGSLMKAWQSVPASR